VDCFRDEDAADRRLQPSLGSEARGKNMMKNSLFFLSMVLGLASTSHAQGPTYVHNAESCVSIRNASGGGKMFYNTCSNRIYISVFTNDGLVFDGYHNNGHMDDIPAGDGSRYKYFACPANAAPVDPDTSAEADFSTTSYQCKVSGS
jgi:hypothetical protein